MQFGVDGVARSIPEWQGLRGRYDSVREQSSDDAFLECRRTAITNVDQRLIQRQVAELRRTVANRHFVIGNDCFVIEPSEYLADADHSEGLQFRRSQRSHARRAEHI